MKGTFYLNLSMAVFLAGVSIPPEVVRADQIDVLSRGAKLWNLWTEGLQKMETIPETSIRKRRDNP